MDQSLIEILLNWPKPYISGTDLKNIINKSDNSRYGIIKRAIRGGYLIPIRRDLYLVKGSKASSVNTFEIAGIIYGPSYVSFESALSYHGWIPEAVRTTTCASSKRSQEFETPLGIFSYEYVPIKAFAFGVERHCEEKSNMLIASPEKSIADLIYARGRLWTNANDLYEDMRIEEEVFRKVDEKLLLELMHNYPSSNVRKVLNNLLKEIL